MIRRIVVKVYNVPRGISEKIYLKGSRCGVVLEAWELGFIEVSIAISRYFILSSVPVPKQSERLGLCLDDRPSALMSMISCGPGSLHSSLFDSDLGYLVPASYSYSVHCGRRSTKLYLLNAPARFTPDTVHPGVIRGQQGSPSSLPYSPKDKNVVKERRHCHRSTMYAASNSAAQNTQVTTHK